MTTLLTPDMAFALADMCEEELGYSETNIGVVALRAIASGEVVVVPSEPTLRMGLEGSRVIEDGPKDFADKADAVYRAMLAALASAQAGVQTAKEEDVSVEEAVRNEEASYNLGLSDGYEKAIQELDVATGGDGEFFGSTIPGETVDVAVMKARVIARLSHPPQDSGAGPVYVIFDGQPSHESGRFVEVETADGKSLRAGEWETHPKDAELVRLGPFYTHPTPDLSVLVERFLRWPLPKRFDPRSAEDMLRFVMDIKQ